VTEKKAVFTTQPVDWSKLADLNQGPWLDAVTGEPIEPAKPQPTDQTWAVTVGDSAPQERDEHG
jgi:hypothetical protein